MNERLIRLPEVKDITGLSRTSIYRNINEGNFPHSVALGGRAVAWVESEVRAWVSKMIEENQRPVLYGYEQEVQS